MVHPPEHPEKSTPPARPGLARGILRFLRENRLYWMAPAILIIVLIGLLLLIAGSSVAPFTYPDP